jgi:hypothetical protein
MIGNFQSSTAGMTRIQQARTLYTKGAVGPELETRAEATRDLFAQIEQVGSPQERLVVRLTREVASTPNLDQSLAQTCWRAAALALADFTPGVNLTVGRVLGQMDFRFQELAMMGDSPEDQRVSVSSTLLRGVAEHGTPNEQLLARTGLADTEGGLQTLYTTSYQLSDYRNPDLTQEVSLAKLGARGVDQKLVTRAIADHAHDPAIRAQAQALAEQGDSYEFLWNLAQRG